MKGVVLLALVAFVASTAPNVNGPFPEGREARMHKFVCADSTPCTPNPGRQMTWFTIQLRNAVRSLQGHSATAVSGGVVVIGGLADGRCSSDIYLLDTRINTWQLLEYTGTFTPRYNHITVSSPESRTMMIFGGQCHSEHFNDLLLFDMDSHAMSRLETSGSPPPLTEGSQGQFVGKYLIVFGGCGYVPQRTCLNTVHTLHLDTLVWVERTTTGDIPDGRDGHAMVALGNQVYVFGGHTEQDVMNDLFVLDVSAWEWHRLDTTGTAPPAVEFPTMTLVNRTALLFGGCRPDYPQPVEASPVASVRPAATPVANPPVAAVAQDAKLGSSSSPEGVQPTTKQPLHDREMGEGDEVMGPLSDVAFLEIPREIRQANTAEGPSTVAMRPGESVRLRLPNHNDLCNGAVYRLDFDTLEWSTPLVTGTRPSPREDHASAMVDGKLYVIGGCQQRHCVGDVYMLDTELHCLDDCHGHGHCVQGICHCNHKFSGVSCQLDFRCPHNCTLRGFCRDALCHCDAGFDGPDCSRDIRCPANCSGHGVCVNAQCQCEKPFHGDGCQQATDCPADCCGHGLCSFGYCYCDVGYEGDSCCNASAVEPRFEVPANVSVVVGDANETLANGTETVFVYVGSSKLCGGSPLAELRNGSFAHCQTACVLPTALADNATDAVAPRGPCTHIAWFPARSMCRLYDAAACDEMWSSPGVQMFQRDPLPDAPVVKKPAGGTKKHPTGALTAAATTVTAPAAGSEAKGTVGKAGVAEVHSSVRAMNPTTAQAVQPSFGVFVYLGVGVLIGTVLGLVGKTVFSSRRSRDDEFF